MLPAKSRMLTLVLFHCGVVTLLFPLAVVAMHATVFPFGAELYWHAMDYGICEADSGGEMWNAVCIANSSTVM